MRDAQSWFVRIKFGNTDQRVLHLQRHQQEVTGPKLEFWAMDDYVDEFGDPKSNGLSHKTGVYQATDGVWVPGRRIWSFTDKKIEEAQAETIVDDGSFVMDGTQISSAVQGCS